MKAVLALLLGVAFGFDQNPYGALQMKDSWKEEITFDWDELDHAKAFKSWQKEFGKDYSSLEEEATRFITFLDNWRYINDFNIAGEESFTLRINQFSDMTGDQFKLYIHGDMGSCMQKRSVQQRVAMRPVTPQVPAATSVDWTNVDGKSYVTPVKNQGQCGSCWAFSTTGSLESRTAIKNQQTGSAITSLSEQQLVDCSNAEGNQGCNGGLMDNAFKYIEKSGGLCSETEYAYTARNGACKSTTCGTMYDPITSYSDGTAIKNQHH
jgi:cathepsin L